MKCRKGQLVCQHLEKISRDALGKYQDIIRDYVRELKGSGLAIMQIVIYCIAGPDPFYPEVKAFSIIAGLFEFSGISWLVAGS